MSPRKATAKGFRPVRIDVAADANPSRESGSVKLRSYAIDDIHQMALAEFDEDEDAQRQLNAVYEEAQKNLITVLMSLRAKARWRHER